MVYHGNTLTSKVSVRDICQAMAKYAFVASPHPVIISAEVHCGLAQQDQIVDIMTEVFGDSLIQAPVDGRPKIQALPSPEDLKYQFLLKVGFSLLFLLRLYWLIVYSRPKTFTL
jgi:phosphatidylinositol phospholipase C, delta